MLIRVFHTPRISRPAISALGAASFLRASVRQSVRWVRHGSRPQCLQGVSWTPRMNPLCEQGVYASIRGLLLGIVVQVVGTPSELALAFLGTVRSIRGHERLRGSVEGECLLRLNRPGPSPRFRSLLTVSRLRRDGFHTQPLGPPQVAPCTLRASRLADPGEPDPQGGVHAIHQSAGSGPAVGCEDRNAGALAARRQRAERSLSALADVRLLSRRGARGVYRGTASGPVGNPVPVGRAHGGRS